MPSKQSQLAVDRYLPARFLPFVSEIEPRSEGKRSQVLRCSRPPRGRPGSYRAGRSSGPMPRTCSSDGSGKLDCPLIIRLTPSGQPASRIFWRMTILLKPLNESPATPTAGPRNSMTAAAKRFCSKIWREFDIEPDNTGGALPPLIEPAKPLSPQ